MNEYKLVNGEFSAQEAQKVIMSLINSKINYHNLVSFSDFVRFNTKAEKSKTRVDELIKTRDDLLELLKKADQNNQNLKIKSFISIELI